MAQTRSGLPPPRLGTEHEQNMKHAGHKQLRMVRVRAIRGKCRHVLLTESPGSVTFKCPLQHMTKYPAIIREIQDAVKHNFKYAWNVPGDSRHLENVFCKLMK